MNHNFDKPVDRRRSESLKWLRYGEDILPMWLADMDFECPEIMLDVLRERINHGIFGYHQEPHELREVIIERLNRKHGLNVMPESIVFFPGVVNSLSLIYRAILNPNDRVIVHTPAYPPFLKGPIKNGMVCHDQELIYAKGGGYEMDPESFEAAIEKNDRLFVLCNPHNPTGRVFTRDELYHIAKICLEKKLIICSDDIHCDIVYSGSKYIPIASLDEEIAGHTITLMSPSKAFNIASLKTSMAIIPNADLREKVILCRDDMDMGVNILGAIATLSAYRDCQPWLDELIKYLEINRDIMRSYIEKEIPCIKLAKIEGTFLAWLDCRKTGISGNLYQFFLKYAKVAVNDGVSFGKGGEGFVRLNFGCPSHRLLEALSRMKKAIYESRL
ncbi:MAG: pyridoxal phosphate-dependent aminotransferase [Deltaproteobacteria bacterium]|nr:pyridoxal phosphate-dependent aminotransferase [Deltaproteobacteria bacterium]